MWWNCKLDLRHQNEVRSPKFLAVESGSSGRAPQSLALHLVIP